MAKKSKINPTRKPARSADAAAKRGYPDLHEHLEALKRAGLLITVDRPINKGHRRHEMHPLVRCSSVAGSRNRTGKRSCSRT